MAVYPSRLGVCHRCVGPTAFDVQFTFGSHRVFSVRSTSTVIELFTLKFVILNEIIPLA